MNIEPSRADGAAVCVLGIGPHIHAAVFVRTLELGILRERVGLLKAADVSLLVGIDDAHARRAVRRRRAREGGAFRRAAPPPAP